MKLVYCGFTQYRMPTRFYACFIFISVLFQWSYAGIKFNERTSKRDELENRQVVLVCPVREQNLQNYSISWLEDTKRIVNTSRRFQQDNQLKITSLDRNLDSGAFQCKVTNKYNKEDVYYGPTQFINIQWVGVNNITLNSPNSAQAIVPGIKVDLQCGVQGNPNPGNFSWWLNGTSLARDKRYRFRQSRLVIRSAALRVYDGTYNCCAQYKGKNYCSTPANLYKLSVIDLTTPQVLVAPRDTFAADGATAQLHCRFTATPAARVAWFRDGRNRELTNVTRGGACRRCVFPNGTLSLTNFRERNAGVYVCKAMQLDKPRASVSATLAIATIDKFSPSSKVEDFTTDENLEHVCESSGTPEPITTWMKDGKNLGTRGGKHVSVIGKMLVIDQPRRSDAGNYTCLARNEAGQVSLTLILRYSEKASVRSLTSRTIDEGSNLTWVCPVTGVPHPLVTWFRDGEELLNSSRTLVIGDWLTVFGVNRNDEGSYNCEADNWVGSPDRSNSVKLKVKEYLKIQPPLQDRCLEEGEVGHVDCKVAGASKPTIEWRVVNSTDQVATRPSSGVGRTMVLPRVGARDARSYMCQATDGKLHVNGTMRVRVVRRPRIAINPQDCNVYVGDPVRMDCSLESGDLKAQWKRGNQIFRSATSSTSSHVFVHDNGSLVIRSAKKTDSGSYTCSYAHQGCRDIVANASAVITVDEERAPPSGPDFDDDDDDVTPGSNTTQLIQTIALSVSGGIAYVLITVALIVYFRGRHRKKRDNKSNGEEGERMLNGSFRGNNHNGDELVNVDNGIPMTVLRTLDPDIANLQYPAEKIKAITVIGKGDFGEVFLSKAPGLFPDLEEDILVMVKSLDQHSDNEAVNDAYRSEFNREISILHKANHDNIVKLLAVCCRDSCSKPDYLVTEYLEWGILKLCLQASKKGSIPKFTKQNKMNMCYQIACGLEHLAKTGLVHRDLATRNCVVSSQLLIKISMLGLDVEGFENEYVEHDGRLLPVRWMAPESVSGYQFSTRSDVWSFGVTCWEIFNLGRFPHDDLTDELVLQGALNGETPSLPPLEGSKRITSLINKCCGRSISSRPDIKQIAKKLHSITGEWEAAAGATPTGAGDSPDAEPNGGALIRTQADVIIGDCGSSER